MSERDLKRIEVLSDVRAGRRTVAAAAGILERSSVSQELGGKYIDLYHFSDGRLELRSNGRVLPYRVFDKDQRVSPAAVVENKRLGHALSRIKLQQDAKLPPKIETNRYKKRGRTICAPPAEAAVEICKIAKSGDFTHSHSTTASYL